MRERLIEAGLWEAGNSNDPAQSVTASWQVLARLGAACRYVGRTPDGGFEYLVYHPETGLPVATGCGMTAALAMCEAALQAWQQGSGKFQ